MTFHDPMAIAQNKMTKVCLFLEQYHLPPTPLNYHFVYTHISKTNVALSAEIAQAIKDKIKIDSIYIEQLYFKYLNQGHKIETTMLKNVGHSISSLCASAQSSEQQITQFKNNVDSCIRNLDEYNVTKSKKALSDLSTSTEKLFNQNEKFKKELVLTQTLHKKALQQINQLKKQHIIDPQTGMFKRHYLNQQAELWFSQNKAVCAITVHLCNIEEFTSSYGDVLGEIVLRKVAKKIQKYVIDSGCPGRTGQTDFTVIFNDIEPNTARIIAQKIQSGVEKLKFISSKAKIELPNIQLAMGIVKRSTESDFDSLAKKATYAAHKAISLNQDYFVVP